MEYIISLALFMLTMVLYVLWNKTRRHKDWPPGPPTVPFIGNLNIIMTDMIVEYRKLREKYGDIFSLILGTQTVIVVNGLETLREIFVKYGDITSDRADLFYFKEINHRLESSIGIAGSSGEIWRIHRTFAISTLRDLGFGTNSLEGKVKEEADTLVESIRDIDGKPFDISDMLNIVTANVMCLVIYGLRYDHDDDRIKKLLEMHANLFNDTKGTGLLTFLPFLKCIPGDPVGYCRLNDAAKAIAEYLTIIIEEHMKNADKNVITNYLDAYRIQQTNEGHTTSFTEEQLLRSADDIFSAGSESTATTMRWLILVLLHKPDIQQRMHKEIVDVVGEARLPSYTERTNLPYCDAVTHEAMRFANVFPFAAPHSLSEDLYLKDYMIPKHAYLIPNLDSIINDPELFSDPYEFNPARFLTNDITLQGTENVYLGVFGVGRRSCIGESLARMEIFLYATALVQKFQLLPAEDHPLPSLTDYQFGIARVPLPYTLRAVEYT